MFVRALEITYCAIRLNHPSKDLVPWVSVFLPLAAVFYAVSVLVIPTSWELDSLLGAPAPFKNLTLHSAAAFGLAAVVVWLRFDRRRPQLDVKYAYLQKLDSTAAVIWLCVAVYAAGSVLLLLARRQPEICLVVFVLLCAIPYLLVRKYE